MESGMPMELEKNTYGLSEGVFKACQFLGLKFPPGINNPPPPIYRQIILAMISSWTRP